MVEALQVKPVVAVQSSVQAVHLFQLQAVAQVQAAHLFQLQAAAQAVHLLQL